MSDPETPDDEPSGTTESAEAPAAESPETSPSGDDTQSENETEATSEPGDEKTSKTSSGVPTGPASEQGAPKEPRIVVAEAIDPKHIDSDAKRVVARLRRAGFEAFLVGGCVRDLLLDKQPKDWDVITSAMPAEIRKVFSNSRIVGRRFRLVHVLFSSKVIEVSTFRAASTPGTLAEAKALQEETLCQRRLAGKTNCPCRHTAGRARPRRRFTSKVIQSAGKTTSSIVATCHRLGRTTRIRATPRTTI